MTNTTLLHQVHIPIDIIIFFTYWCMPCVTMLNELPAVFNQWQQTYMHSVRCKSTAYAAYIRNIQYINVDDDATTTIVPQFNITSVPTIMLIDTLGQTEIRHTRSLGSSSSPTVIRELIETWERSIINHLETFYARH